MNERVITVSLQSSREDDLEAHQSMEELRRLTETAGGVVVATIVQKRDTRNPATFIGKGKVQELAAAILEFKAKTVIFNDNLKPVQQRNLEEALSAKVIDRTRLILDIFAQRARTREGILQVELAQLDYRLPRLAGLGAELDSQTGGIGTRGPGEKKLEVDQRRIRDRMAYLRKQIEKISGERVQQRSVRRSVPVPQVAIVGYTNAGKSTLLNALVKEHGAGNRAKVYADDKLFATLDPTTRRVRLPSGHRVLFSDTVGFIRKLPTELIAAFRATLEEAAEADLILHVVDASDPVWHRQHDTVLDILRQLKMDGLPRVTAYNKMDLLSSTQRLEFSTLEGVCLSAGVARLPDGTENGLSDLIRSVEQRLSEQWVEQDLFFGYHQGDLLAQLHESMDVLTQVTSQEGIHVRVRTHPATLAQWAGFVGRKKQ